MKDEKLTLEWDGQVYSDWNIDDLIAKGVPEAFVTSEIMRQKFKRKIRGQINQNVGDVETLLGTTSDAAALAVYGLAALVTKLSTATSLAEVRDAAEPFAQLSAGFLAKVESGEVTLPFMQKGIENVVTDIETSATAVSAALKTAQKGE